MSRPLPTQTLRKQNTDTTFRWEYSPIPPYYIGYPCFPPPPRPPNCLDQNQQQHRHRHQRGNRMSKFYTLKIENDNGETGYVVARYDSPVDTAPTYRGLDVNGVIVWIYDLQKAIIHDSEHQANIRRGVAERYHQTQKGCQWRLVSEQAEVSA